MTKKELAEKVAEALALDGKQHITKTQVEATLDALSDVAVSELMHGGEVPLPGIGKLKTLRRAARQGRNPRTGAALAVPERRAAKFSASATLKKVLA